MSFCCGCATGCTCAGGAPVGWKNIGPAGGPFGRGRFGSFGNSNSNNNNNNNNNNNSSNASNTNNAVSSMLSNLLGMQNAAGSCGLPVGCGGLGCGLPFGQGFGCGGMGIPGGCFDGCCGGPCSCGCDPCICGGGFGGNCVPWGNCCSCPTGCRDAWSCTGATGGCCNGVCWKKFKIVTPGGQEQCFPVAVPWWMCDATGTTGAGLAEASNETAQATGPQDAVPAEATGPMGCMSASQLLMQRYMIANPPRAFNQFRNERGCYAAEELEAVPCPQEGDELAVAFNPAAMDVYQNPGVLIPSKEAE